MGDPWAGSECDPSPLTSTSIYLRSSRKGKMFELVQGFRKMRLSFASLSSLSAPTKDWPPPTEETQFVIGTKEKGCMYTGSFEDMCWNSKPHKKKAKSGFTAT